MHIAGDIVREEEEKNRKNKVNAERTIEFFFAGEEKKWETNENNTKPTKIYQPKPLSKFKTRKDNYLKKMLKMR